MSVSAELAAIAKVVFAPGAPRGFVDLHSIYGDVKKVENDTGKDIEFSVTQSQGACGSATYSDVYALAGNAQYSRFTVTPITDYALARMNGEDMERLTGAGAVVDAWTDRINTAIYEARCSLAIQMTRAGTGSRGQIASTANVATNNVALSDATLGSADIHGFYQGQAVCASATDGGACRVGATTSEIVAAVDAANGTLTSTSVAWSTVITTIAASDFLGRRGDMQNNAAVKVITGLEAWLVGGASPAALFGCTRTVAPVVLAGTAFDATGVPIEEAVLELANRISIYEGDKRTFYCHPRDKVQLVKLLESKSRFIRPTQGSTAKVGFEGVEFETDAGPMGLKGDIRVQRRKGYILDPKACELNSVGKAPKIIQKDGQTVRARDNADAYEMRIGTYGSFLVRRPFSCGRLSNWGA